MSKSQLENLLLAWIKAYFLPEPTREYRFHKIRKFRFDFAYPDLKIAIECEGGIFLKGNRQSRHTRGAGYAKDCEKYNLAVLEGWKVLRITPNMNMKEVVNQIDILIKKEEKNYGKQ